MKYSNVCFGYLTFINENNRERRINLFEESLRNLSGMKGKCHLVSFDNNSLPEVKKELIDFKFNLNFHFDTNFYDLSVLYGTYYVSKKLGCDYMIYSYDDVAYMQNNFLKDSIEFLDKNLDVDFNLNDINL